MLDLFTIFSKGGFVLWCFQGTSQSLASSVNALIKSVILQERGGLESFTHEALTLKYKLDNEFELVFVVAYQRILQLSYVDKFLSDIQLEFRNKYKNDLVDKRMFTCSFDFTETFNRLLQDAEEQSRTEALAQKKMRTFDESKKSQKTVASMIESKPGSSTDKSKHTSKNDNGPQKSGKAASPVVTPPPSPPSRGNQDVASSGDNSDGGVDVDTIQKNREKMLAARNKKPAPFTKKVESPKETGKKGKAMREWDLSGTRKVEGLDYSGGCNGNGTDKDDFVATTDEEIQQVGRMAGALKELDEGDDFEDEEDADDEEDGATPAKAGSKPAAVPSAGRGGKAAPKKSSYGGFWSGLKSLVGAKQLTPEVLQPVLEKMRDHLIAKNVAADIAEKLCQSVETKLEGRTIGTFTTITSTVKKAVEEACMQILSSKRRVDVLRDALEARQMRRPYSITFCGVNGVGKSTNLAKVSFWLVENGLRVLIAACDTFRAGAVEQLRTHVRKLTALHPPEKYGGSRMIELYDKGYGKDAAGVAMEALTYARDCRYDVVLIDTAGRMQDNEPLMRALAKLIKVNQPNLVLFVGEALVGNDGVDQLVKFNRALADYSDMENPRLIDGIVLTKFDTIDDQVGAAVSMTYTTGQPIVFVGTGQTYTDLKNLNARAVVNSLLKA